MKLVNYLTLRITLYFTIIMLLWSGVYLWLQMQEIHEGIDESLINLKQEFVINANTIERFVEIMERTQPINTWVNEITFDQAKSIVDHFETTKIHFPTVLEEKEVRMLTSAFLCTLNGKYYQIRFFTPTVEIDDMIKHILYLTFGLWIALIITFIIISRIVISRVNKPFYQLLSNLKRFRVDKSKTIVLPETKIIEYAQLNKAVDELISKNTNIFAEQKEFIENSSHELQTPIAIAIAKLELLTEKYPNDEAHVGELAELIGILNRMKRLNTSLLLLSKVRNNQFVDAHQINLNEELQETLNEFSDFIDYKEITVVLENQATVEKIMNADLARILFINLLKNAITYSDKGGKIEIVSTSNRITISNTGAQPLDDVFTRYQKTKSSEKSSGLGLSIVKSIVDLYRIQMGYSFEQGRHVFTLTF